MLDPRTLPVFGNLTKLEMDEIMSFAAVRLLNEGEVVFRENESSDAFYVLLRGKVEITKTDASGAEQSLALLEPPGVFGETVLFLSPPRRIASARATAESEVLSIDVVRFLERVDKGSHGAFKIIHYLGKVIAWRLKVVDEELVSRMGTAQANRTKPLEEFSSFKEKLFKEWNF